MHSPTLLVVVLTAVTTIRTTTPTVVSSRPVDGSVIKVVVTGGPNAGTYTLTSTENSLPRSISMKKLLFLSVWGYNATESKD